MFENKIYIPKEVQDTFNVYNCHLVQDNKIISLDSNSICNDSYCVLSTFNIDTIHYTYNFKDNYLSQGEFNSLVSSCIYNNYSNFTFDVFYRNDLDSILIIFLILILILIIFPFRLLSRLFGRWLKW